MECRSARYSGLLWESHTFPSASLQATGETPSSIMAQVGDVETWGPGDRRPADLDTDLFPKDELYLN